MTEPEWLRCDDPLRLLKSLRAGRWWRSFLPRRLDGWRANARKMRLLACAYERMLGPADGPYLRHVLATAERYADGEATIAELQDRTHDPGAIRLAAVDDQVIPTFKWREENWGYVRRDLTDWATRRMRLSRLLRCLFNPFRPAAINASCLVWNNGTVVKLARTIYEDGWWELMPILGDASEDSGCTKETVLSHCRSEGPHFRGCWVVDLLLEKE